VEKQITNKSADDVTVRPSLLDCLLPLCFYYFSIFTQITCSKCGWFIMNCCADIVVTIKACVVAIGGCISNTRTVMLISVCEQE